MPVPAKRDDSTAPAFIACRLTREHIEAASESWTDFCNRYQGYVFACPRGLAVLDQCERSVCGVCIGCEVDRRLDERLAVLQETRPAPPPSPRPSRPGMSTLRTFRR